MRQANKKGAASEASDSKSLEDLLAAEVGE